MPQATLETIAADLDAMKVTIDRVADALDRLARLEERNKRQAEDILETRARLVVLEKDAPLNRLAAKWVIGVATTICLLVGSAAIKVLLSPSVIASAPPIHGSQAFPN